MGDTMRMGFAVLASAAVLASCGGGGGGGGSRKTPTATNTPVSTNTPALPGTPTSTNTPVSTATAIATDTPMIETIQGATSGGVAVLTTDDGTTVGFVPSGTTIVVVGLGSPSATGTTGGGSASLKARLDAGIPLLDVPVPFNADSCTADPVDFKVVCIGYDTSEGAILDVRNFIRTGEMPEMTPFDLGNTVTADNFSAASCLNCGVIADPGDHRFVLSSGDGYRVVDYAGHLLESYLSGPQGAMPDLATENFGFDPTRNLIVSPEYETQNNFIWVVNLDKHQVFRWVKKALSTAIDPDGLPELPRSSSFVWDAVAIDATTGIVTLGNEFDPVLLALNFGAITFNDAASTFDLPYSVTVLNNVLNNPGDGLTTGMVAEPASHLLFLEEEFTNHMGVVELPTTTASGPPAVGSYTSAVVPPPGPPCAREVQWQNPGDPHGLAVFTAPMNGGPAGFLINSAKTCAAIVNLDKLRAAPKAAGQNIVDSNYDLIANQVVQFKNLKAATGDALARGLASLAAGDVIGANAAFGEAHTARPSDPGPTLYRSLSQLVTDALRDPNLLSLLGRGGVAVRGGLEDVCALDVTAPAEVSDSAPRSGEILDALNAILVPRLQTALTTLQSIPPSAVIRFNLSNLPACVRSGRSGTVEIDHGDILALIAALQGTQAFVELLGAYNLDVGLRSAAMLPPRMTFDSMPDLLTLRSASRLDAARSDSRLGLTALIDTIDAVRSETDDQSDDLLIIGDNIDTANRTRQVADLIRQSLDGEVVIPTEVGLPRPQRLNLNPLFSATFQSLRGFVPAFDANSNPDPHQFPDPTFGGTFPDFTQQTIDELVSGGPVCGVCQTDADCVPFSAHPTECAACTFDCTGDVLRCTRTSGFEQCEDGYF